MTAVVLDGALLEGAIERIIRPDYQRFAAQLRSSGYCERPVRLQGRVDVCDGYGRRQQVWTTDGEPDGLLRKACGNRREAVCAPCAERYRGDALQLIAAGLRGGKGVPESVMGHPAVFATLTAPSFGVVHAHLLGPDGQPLRCHPRRERPVCEHGVVLSCSRVHGPEDPCLGEPLCAECFDYEGAVIWNNLLGELWRRTTIYLRRATRSAPADLIASLQAAERSVKGREAASQCIGLDLLAPKGASGNSVSVAIGASARLCRRAVGSSREAFT